MSARSAPTAADYHPQPLDDSPDDSGNHGSGNWRGNALALIKLLLWVAFSTDNHMIATRILRVVADQKFKLTADTMSHFSRGGG